MAKTYWEGKQTEATRILDEATVSYGLTENASVNAHIIANRIYYDVYNNGGGNLFDSWGRETPTITDYIDIIREADIGMKFGKINLNLTLGTIKKWMLKENDEGDYGELEVFMDEIFEALSKEDLTFTVYKLWHLHDKNLMTINEETANTDEWSLMTFGRISQRAEYIKDSSWRKLV